MKLFKHDNLIAWIKLIKPFLLKVFNCGFLLFNTWKHGILQLFQRIALLIFVSLLQYLDEFLAVDITWHVDDETSKYIVE